MPLDHISSRDRLHEFRKLKPTQEENRKEARTTSCEGAGSVKCLPVEETANNETVRNDDN
jgi:hypothetical protein